VQFRRLSWAGVEVVEGGWRVLIDPLEDTLPFRAFAGPPRAPLVPVKVDGRTWAVVTHIHRDHCDRSLLARLPPGHVICHSTVAAALNEEGLRATGVDLWSTMSVGPFQITPVPSQDWRSDDQVAWVIERDSQRIIHCGDTIWHGQWYAIARRYGSFDVAFLPINGFIAQLEGFTSTDIPGSLTPEQAIEAAVVLNARTACAIHHTLFDNPPLYAQQPNAVGRFHVAARRRGVHAIAPGDGEALQDARVKSQSSDTERASRL
jgi:L-ascorbate metabolism protein UlaG (beta-lactamase superfamily)